MKMHGRFKIPFEKVFASMNIDHIFAIKFYWSLQFSVIYVYHDNSTILMVSLFPVIQWTAMHALQSYLSDT